MIVIGASAFIASFIAFFSGFGLSTILMPILAIFFPLEIAIGFTAIVHLFHSLVKTVLFWKSIDWKIVIQFGLAAALAAIFGAWLLQELSAIPPLKTYDFFALRAQLSVLHIVIGSLLIIFATLELLQFHALKINNLWIGGLISGFFSGLSGNQGAFRSVFLVANLEKLPFIATSAIISVFVDSVRLIVYALTFSYLLGEIQPSFLVSALIGALGGIFIGLAFLPKLTIESIKFIVAVLLYLLGVLLIAGVI